MERVCGHSAEDDICTEGSGVNRRLFKTAEVQTLLFVLIRPV